MKKTRLLLVLTLLYFALNEAVGQNQQWDIYSNIPNFKEISLYFSDEDAMEVWAWDDRTNSGEKKKGANLSMTIFDDYSVSLYYSNDYENNGAWGLGNFTVPFTITGKGVLLWQNEHMVLKLDVKKYSSGEDAYIGGQFDAYYHISSINSTNTYVYNVEYNESSNAAYFVFDGDNISANRQTYTTRTTTYGATVTDAVVDHVDVLRMSGVHYIKNAVQKSQSEMNIQNSDMYGKWQWNNDRSRIYLESTTKDASLVIWNHKNETENLRNRIVELENDTTLSWDLKQSMIEGVSRQIQRYQQNPIAWGFDLGNGTGYKTEMADNGEELTFLMITFDGESEQSFSFVKTGNYFEYAQYDRFMGTLKRDASILNQIKEKRIMILNYKQNGSTKTAMFQLEGLEAIYNAITQ